MLFDIIGLDSTHWPNSFTNAVTDWKRNVYLTQYSLVHRLVVVVHVYLYVCTTSMPFQNPVSFLVSNFDNLYTWSTTKWVAYKASD